MMNRLFRWCILAPIISNSLLFSSYSNLRRVGDSLEATDRSDVGSLVLEENDDIIVEAEKIDNFSLDNNLSINDDLLLVTEELDDRYIPRSGNSSYGFNKFKNEEKEEEMKSLYLSLADTCEQFIVSYDDVTPDSKGRYVIGEYDINEFNLTLNETVSVWKIFYVENPAYYWLTNKVTIASQNKLLLMIDKDYSYGVARNKYDKDIKNMLDDCNSLIIDSMSELEKYRIINDYVVSTLNYAYKEGSSLPETSIWAHNLVGSSTKGLGVCESYAKTYMYLCLQNGLKNIIVTGRIEGGINHAWNMIYANNKWSYVDTTWNDTEIEGLLDHTFFAVGKKKMADHFQDNNKAYGINYLYELPTTIE